MPAVSQRELTFSHEDFNSVLYTGARLLSTQRVLVDLARARTQFRKISTPTCACANLTCRAQGSRCSACWCRPHPPAASHSGRVGCTLHDSGRWMWTRSSTRAAGPHRESWWPPEKGRRGSHEARLQQRGLHCATLLNGGWLRSGPELRAPPRQRWTLASSLPALP